MCFFDSTYRFLKAKFGPTLLHLHRRLHVYQSTCIMFTIRQSGACFQKWLRFTKDRNDAVKCNHCMKINICKERKSNTTTHLLQKEGEGSIFIKSVS